MFRGVACVVAMNGCACVLAMRACYACVRAKKRRCSGKNVDITVNKRATPQIEVCVRVRVCVCVCVPADPRVRLQTLRVGEREPAVETSKHNAGIVTAGIFHRRQLDRSPAPKHEVAAPTSMPTCLLLCAASAAPRRVQRSALVAPTSCCRSLQCRN